MPSGMDGLERAALTEKSQGDASRRPRRRSFTAPALGGGSGGGGGVGNWYLLTPSALALLEFIVAVVAVRSCCSALRDARLRVFGCVVRIPTARDKTGSKKTISCEGVQEMVDFFHTEVHLATEYFMYCGSLKAM